jgi:hypothetical protein
VCEVLLEEDMCRTISPVHGSPCIMRHIHSESLTDFAFQNCSSVVGGLSIDNLPRHLDEEALESAFQELHIIIGTLTVSENPYLTSLSFLKNLRQVSKIVIRSNPMLVDARLPSLDTSSLDEARDILVSKNPRLHPTHRYPLSPTDPDSDPETECYHCPHLSATFLLQVTSANSSFSSSDFHDFISNEVLGLNVTDPVVVSSIYE